MSKTKTPLEHWDETTDADESDATGRRQGEPARRWTFAVFATVQGRPGEGRGAATEGSRDR